MIDILFKARREGQYTEYVSTADARRLVEIVREAKRGAR